ncbi:MAG: UDP-N-acetylmuramoyl-L-alanyl-D-glutamate--2,6-diaminopimelate ligase [Clostridia bacterium]|nr:UDP-N-acetylmuramoyl-L-alanyl-D-glutamate--2,6-diaminopimelate ligase [Clostridia bacterium]
MQRLKNLLLSIGIPEGEIPCPQMPISDIVYDSRKAREGVIFVCIVGAVADGHKYARSAYDKGARVFVCEKPLSLPADALVFRVENTRRALASLSACHFDHPEKKLRVIGVTGTKGKSTICEMIRHILCKNGIPAASVGTVGVRIGDTVTPTGNTTPESYELFRIFAEMVERGVCYAVIEVSSQGIKLDRVFGISFFAAIMTNLSEDHIGGAEHPDFDDYKACKKALFRRCEHAIFNADDPYFEEFWESAPGNKQTYSITGDADLSARSILSTATEKGFGSSFLLKCGDAKADAFVPFPGEFSVSNALAAVAAAMLADVSAESAADALSDVRVAGRFEIVPTTLAGATFVIDYAHNGESLTAALCALRKYRPKRLVCLFGSVGGRTEIRRRELGIAASAYADFSILTSDNPDREPPLDVIADIEKYMQNAPYAVIPDRKEAIEYAVAHAEEGDIVLLAGKGHENYQLIDGKKQPFCEREILLAAAEKIMTADAAGV